MSKAGGTDRSRADDSNPAIGAVRVTVIDAVEEQVAASTQNQALGAVVCRYQQVLHRRLCEGSSVTGATRQFVYGVPSSLVSLIQ